MDPDKHPLRRELQCAVHCALPQGGRDVGGAGRGGATPAIVRPGPLLQPGRAAWGRLGPLHRLVRESCPTPRPAVQNGRQRPIVANLPADMRDKLCYRGGDGAARHRPALAAMLVSVALVVVALMVVAPRVRRACALASVSSRGYRAVAALIALSALSVRRVLPCLAVRCLTGPILTRLFVSGAAVGGAIHLDGFARQDARRPCDGGHGRPHSAPVRYRPGGPQASPKVASPPEMPCAVRKMVPTTAVSGRTWAAQRRTSLRWPRDLARADGRARPAIRTRSRRRHVQAALLEKVGK